MTEECLPRDLWETPIRLFDRLHHGRQFNFTCDAAASPKNALCGHFYSEQNSLFDECPLKERIFCNPPYSQAQKFTEYCYQLYAERQCHVLMLLPVRCDRVWWNEIKCMPGVRHEFYTGRIHFSGSGKGAFMYNVNFIFGFEEIESLPYIDAGQFNENGNGSAKT